MQGTFFVLIPCGGELTLISLDGGGSFHERERRGDHPGRFGFERDGPAVSPDKEKKGWEGSFKNLRVLMG